MKNKKMTVWLVKHCFDTDGGFGDAIGCEEVVAAFTSHRAAKRFCSKHWGNRVYDVPYAELWCGRLVAVKVEVQTSYDPVTDDFIGWWEQKKRP